MNIVLFLNKDIEASIAYNLIKPKLLAHSVRIYYSDKIGIRGERPSDLIRLEYFEQSFFIDTLAALKKQLATKNSFEFLGDDFHSYPAEKCVDVNSKEFIDEVKSFDPDLFISIRFGKIFKDEVIQIPSKGLINLHSAILPDYRGVMGTLHAIKDRNTRIGCTLHTIPNNGIDTGEIIELAEIDVDYQKSLFWNIVHLYPAGANLIINVLKRIEQGCSLESYPQEPGKGAYYSIPTKRDFEQLRNLGMEAITETDYQEILGKFIFTDLSHESKQRLANAIAYAFNHAI